MLMIVQGATETEQEFWWGRANVEYDQSVTLATFMVQVAS